MIKEHIIMKVKEMTILQSEGLISMLASLLKKEEAYFSAEDFKQIKDIALSTIDYNRKFTPVFLEDLDNFSNLESLTLSKIIIDDEGMEHICHCQKLKRLSLYECEVESLSGIEQLTDLECLELIRTPITDFSPLEKLPLHRLRLIGCRLPDLKFIDRLAHLTGLKLIHCQIADRKLPAHLEHFHSLDICETEFNDYAPLKAAKSLKTLYLTEEQIGRLSLLILELRKKLPLLQIFDQYQNKVP